MQRSLPTQMIRFGGVGALATLLQYALLVLLVEVISAQPLAASVISFAISAVFNYLANYHFTFASTAPHRRSALRFTLVALAALALNGMLFWAAYSVLNWHYLVAQACATVAVLLFNFTMSRIWTFKAVSNPHGEAR